MQVIKDQEKRCYVYGVYLNLIQSADSTGNNAYNWTTSTSQVLNYPIKTNLVPRKMRVQFTCKLDLQIPIYIDSTASPNAVALNTASQVQLLRAINDSFYINFLGQQFWVSPSQPNIYEIDPHMWPSLQDFSQGFGSNLSASLTQPYFTKSGTANGTVFGYFNFQNSNLVIYVQLQINE